MIKHAARLLVAAMLLTTACEKGEYSLKAKIDPDSIAKGGSGNVVITTEAHGEFHLDPKGMVRIELEPSSPKITLDKTSLNQDDNAGDFTYTTGVRVAADAPPGDASVKASIMFQLCKEDLCKLISEERTLSFEVK